MSEADVYRRQILTSKVGHRGERVDTLINAGVCVAAASSIHKKTH